MTDYPPILTRPQAAAMCQLTPSGFDGWVRRGIVPPAIMGTRRWSRDAILKAISGTAVDVEIDPMEQWEREEQARQAAKKR